MKALILACVLLSGCAANQQREVNAAYSIGQTAKAQAVAACAQSRQVASCMLGVAVAFGGGAGDSVPIVRSDLDTVLNSSVLGVVAGAGIGAVRDIKVAQSQERTQIANTQAQAATQTAMFGAFTSVVGTGYNAVAQTSTAGFNSVTSTAQAGFSAANAGAQSLERVSNTAINASAQTAQDITRMPPTFQAGGDIVGRDYVRDQSATGRDRVQGDGNETARNVNCVSTGGNGGPASGSGGSSGTTGTSGSASANAGAGADANNNCGG